MKIVLQKTILGALALGFFFFNPAASAQNAVITWGSPQNISGDSDVFTGGTLVNAYHLGGATVQSSTVSGVTFQAFAFPGDQSQTATVGNYNFTETSDFLVFYNNLGSNVAPFSSLSSSYQALLSTAGGASFESTLVLTISGLTVGQDYVFQFFTSNAANTTSSFSGSNLSTSATAGNSVALVDNTTGADGGLGQFAIGTFTATDVTQTIDFNGGPNFQVPTINAFQLSAVPEPSSIALMLLGVAGLGAMLRFRHSRSA